MRFFVKTAPQIPSRRALAGLALVSVLSAVEKQRIKKNKVQHSKPYEYEGFTNTVDDMSGELQTIPARHGVATFVPRGRTIKVINTYGQQVVSMWAFTLGAPPEDEDDGAGEELDEEQVKREADELKKAVDEGEGKDAETLVESGKEVKKEDERGDDKEAQSTEKSIQDSKQEVKDSPEQAADATQKAKDSSEQTPDTTPDEKAKTAPSSSKQPNKRTWASYLPSIPYRNKGGANKQETEQKPTPEQEKKQNEENTKKWSSYLPTGKSFSSYVPNVEVPDSKSVVSAFKASHYRDPNKSYAEQLYDFSKTPVGAGTMAAATGSGYASSVYAAYSAYTSLHPSNSSQPPMEYLSLPHTRAASHKLCPEVDDELLTNLRNPILTFIEDSSPGAHDTLTAACDANQYAALGVDKPAEHGSCAENLVLALKEINETAGLKGAKAVGADISVNIAPTPLHLFMNAPLQSEGTLQSDGAGTKGVTLSIEEPKGKKRCFVRFRAERDVVIVFSACPMDVGKQNGGRCMASNFLVENVQEGEDLASSISSSKVKKAPKKLGSKGKGEKDQSEEKKTVPEEPKTEQAESLSETPKETEATEIESATPSQKEASEKGDEKKQDSTSEELKVKKKPKKLQVRSKPASTQSQSS
ncbi:hypothetical protein PTTW11_09582 [Pyrenophora teres f. teres]|uniref:DUF1989 domain-containing protein n=1 Tax=Pyrenophora teres f. teres TaxID=97479 RepID=A0A6S6WBV3_9PLEO|nr:hypothetical protein PTNB29_07555 [Pyrenophora teres f. teres]CAE7206618.1 hypothetical protein PTTW11_09582 [Pyrenophora teres f. teres]